MKRKPQHQLSAQQELSQTPMVSEPQPIALTVLKVTSAQELLLDLNVMRVTIAQLGLSIKVMN